MKRAVKWIAILFGIVLLLALAAVLSFPYWFGSALAVGGNRFGAQFGKYERLPGGRFALSDVVRTNRLFDLRVSRVEGFLPYQWYQQTKATNHTNAFLQMDGWRVVVHPRASREGSNTNATQSVLQRWKQFERGLATVRQWLPKATLLNGAVSYGGKEYSLPVVTWDNGKLDAGGVWPETAVPFEVKGKLSGEAPYQVSFLMTPLDIRVRLQASETNGVLNTRLALFYKENRADVTADFGPHDLLPEQATLKAANLKIPAELVRVEQYNEFNGSLTGEWSSNRYSVQLNARAEPLAGSAAPPAEIAIAATGTTNQVRIEQLRSTAPGLVVSLSEPVELSYSGRLVSERSELKIDAQLEKLPWLKLKGAVDATLLLKRGEKFPIATIRAAGSKVEAYNLEFPSLSVEGVFDWPEIKNVSIQAELGKNGQIKVEGGGNVLTREVQKTSISIDAPEGALNILPRGISFSSLRVDASVEGALTNLVHEAKFAANDFATAQTLPVQIDGEWQARQFTFDQLVVRARSTSAVVRLQGRGFSEGDRTNLVLRQITITNRNGPYFELESPATISLLPEGRLEIAPLTLRGPNRSLRLAGAMRWPSAGELNLDAENLDPSVAQDFVRASLKDFDLQRLTVAARWSNGPVTGKIAGRGGAAVARLGAVGADLALELQPAGIAIQQLRVSDRSGEIGRAEGFVPITITPAGSPRISFSKSERIDFELSSTTNSDFWNLIGQMARLNLTNPAINLVVHGTAERPTGEFHLRADAIGLVRTNRELPAIGPLDARLALNEEVLKVRDFSARVLDQPLEVKGQLRLGSNFWNQRREEILDYAIANADLRIEAPNVQVAPFTAYLPKYLSPQGELAMNVAVKPGRNFDGHLRLQGVETRPLPRVGVIQSIQGEVALRGQQINIDELSGVLGGERVTLRGDVDLSPEKIATGYPGVNLTITGQNLPLARNPDVILRSDLNLQVRNGTNAIPIIVGDAVLRDSFLLRDVSTLAPGRVARPDRRPPYFSIEQDPIDEWKLNVRVRGDNFMRVRSPFFQGVVSANFHVVGTALEPMALGEAKINSGTIVFPFASLEVRQALVSLTTEDPYLPHLFAIAEGRAFGFDIRMEAEGPADQPVIQFSSVPVLSSEQIILMLTTGQIPREDFSFSNSDRVSKLAFFLGKSLLQKLRPGNASEEKLTIRSGQDITEQGRQTYEVEYKLSPRWSLVGEYDRFGALNANVKWRLVSR